MEYPVGSGAAPSSAIQPAPPHTSGCPETPICSISHHQSSEPYTIDFGHRKHGHQYDDTAFNHGYYDGYPPKKGLLWPVIFVLVGIAAVASVVTLYFIFPAI